jgi:hypothetical protein
VPGRYGRVTFEVNPPFVESTVRTNVEALFWGQSLGKCVAHVGTKDKEIFRSSDSIEETGAGLIDTVGIYFIKYLDGPGSTRAVAHTACFLTPIDSLDIVSPYKVKDGVVVVDSNGHAKTPLIPVLIELKILRLLPVCPIVLFQEPTSRETHDTCDVLTDVPGFDYGVFLYPGEPRSGGEEVQSVV